MSIFDRFLRGGNSRLRLPQNVLNSLMLWIAELDEGEICRFLQDHLELIRPECEEALQWLAGQVAAERGATAAEPGEMFEQKRNILRRVRERGASRNEVRDACIDEYSAIRVLDLPPWLEALRATMADATDAQMVALAGGALERAERDPAVAPEVLATLQMTLGNALTETGQRLEEATRLLDLALRTFTLRRFPKTYGQTQRMRGFAYGQLVRTTHNMRLLDTVITSYEQALPHYSKEAEPEPWASIHYDLGVAYGQKGDFAGAEEHLNAALTVFTVQRYPEAYARVQGVMEQIARGSQRERQLEAMLDQIKATRGSELAEAIREQLARNRDEE